MKRTLFAAAIMTLALAMGVSAEEQHQGKRAAVANRGARTATAPARVNAHARQVNTRQNTARTFNNRAAVNRQSNAIVRSNARANRVTAREQGVHRARTINNSAVATRTTNRERFGRQQNVQRDRTVTRNVNRNINRDVTVNRTRNINRNVRLVNNWRSDRFAGRNYVAFRNYHRAWHDRGWWHNHYNRIIFVSGGWYFWNGGYWYPAWGYDPGYVYPYDGPIYGYGSLTPDQIVVNVQQQLQDDGYYTGPIDGILGPNTRYAIAAFQADHGLAVTSAVDEPTLSTLGLV
jgi:hypothetical protein